MPASINQFICVLAAMRSAKIFLQNINKAGAMAVTAAPPFMVTKLPKRLRVIRAMPQKLVFAHMKARGLMHITGAGNNITTISTNGIMIGGEYSRCNKLLENLGQSGIYNYV